MKRLILILCLTMFVALPMAMIGDSPVSHAQRPTPTPISDSSGDDDDDDEDLPPPPMGGVQGYVYDYSSGGSPQGGVAVVLDGGGWQAEAVTDSNGFYRFAGLGTGSATLNLRLPPGAHPVTPDWPVFVGRPEAGRANLAFYWGDTPPMPVLLSSNAGISSPANQPFDITLTVQNRSQQAATKGVVDLKIPTALHVLNASVSQGSTDIAEHRVWAYLGNLPPGGSTVVTIRAQFDEGNSPQSATAQATFSYEEQLTPQIITIQLSATAPGEPNVAAIAPVQDNGPPQANASSANTAPNQADPQNAGQAAATPTPPTAVSSNQSAEASSAPTPEIASLIPETGEAAASPPPQVWSIFILALGLIGTLGVAGLLALFPRSAEA